MAAPKLCLDSGGVLSTKSSEKFDGDVIYRQTQDGAYACVQLWMHKHGPGSLKVVSRVNRPNPDHWVVRHAGSLGIDSDDVLLCRDRRHKAYLTEKEQPTVVVDDNYDALYHMATGAWESVNQAVLWDPQPYKGQGQWDMWLQARLVHMSFNADLPKWVELAGLLKLSRNVAVWQFFEDHGPPKQPHRPENVQKALEILEGVSLRRAPGLAAAASVLRNPPPGMLPAASAEAAKDDTAASSLSADAGTATAASAEKKKEGEAVAAGTPDKASPAALIPVKDEVDFDGDDPEIVTVTIAQAASAKTELPESEVLPPAKSEPAAAAAPEETPPPQAEQSLKDEEPTAAPETVPAAAEELQPRTLQPSEAQTKKEAEAAAVEASEGRELEKQNKKKAALAASARPKTKAKPAASAAPKVPAASAAPKVAVKSKATSPAAPAGKKKVASDDSSYYEYDDEEEESQEAPAIRLVEAKDVGERTSAAARSESESEEPVTKKELEAAVGSMKMYMGQMLAAQAAATASASAQYWQPPAAASASSGPSWGGRSESSKWLARKKARAQKYREAPSSSSAPRVVQTPMCRNCGKNQPGAFCQLGLCRPCCNSQWTPCEQHGAWR